MTGDENEPRAVGDDLAEGKARAQQQPSLAILEELYALVETPDKRPLTDQKGPGVLFPGNLGEPPSWGWREEVRVRPTDPAGDVDRIREWLQAQGWERFTGPRPEPEGAARYRRDGYVVRVIGYPDGRILLDVKSPVFDTTGRQVPGLHGQTA